MYIAFGNRVVDSMDMKKLIEDNTEFKVIKGKGLQGNLCIKNLELF